MWSVLILLFLSVNSGRSCDVITKYVCRDNQITVTCPAGRVIDVYDAFYGRKNNFWCGNNEATCEAEGSEEAIVKLCQDQNSCTLSASDDVFGSSCADASPYAQIDYRCVSPVKYQLFDATACKGDDNYKLACAQDHVMVIQSAYYGRANANTCPAEIGGDTRCTVEGVEDVIKASCNNERYCVLSQDDFNDPCPDTDKYFYVQYYCVKKPASLYVKKSIACEHRGSVRITCPRSNVILVTKGFYGRDDRPTCPGASFYTTNCRASTSFDILKRHCDNERSCLVTATNSIFGDPCPRSNKFVKMDYYCVPSATLTLNTEVVCEHQESTVQCPEGKVLSVVGGFYGRDDKDTCPGNVFTTDCNSVGSLKKLQGTCNDRQQCTLEASNEAFNDDPCPDTNKLIKMMYYCV